MLAVDDSTARATEIAHRLQLSIHILTRPQIMSYAADDRDTVVKIGSRASGARATVAKDESVVNAARRTGAAVDTFSKGSGNTQKAGTDHAKIAKLDRDNEVAPPPTVNPGVGKAMMQARMEKKLSQVQLAQQTNEKQSIIADYEAGRATPNPQILGKFERILGVKLRGKPDEIGKPLPPRGGAKSGK